MTKEEFVQKNMNAHRHSFRHFMKPVFRNCYFLVRDNLSEIAEFFIGIFSFIILFVSIPFVAVTHKVWYFRWKHDKKFVEKMWNEYEHRVV